MIELLIETVAASPDAVASPLAAFGYDFMGRVAALVVPAAYVLGALSALDAVMTARTPQGSVAWAVALVAFPLVALPLYWAFGRSRYTEYVDRLRAMEADIETRLGEARAGVLRRFLAPADDERGELAAFQALASFPFTRGNGARLLVDGQATFAPILEAIDRAEHYCLVQFYILRDDGLGRVLQERLARKARAGVRVCLLYDDVGSFWLSRRYRRALQASGVEVSGFPGRRGWLRRFRVNFRNHRKIVVVDGRVAFVGGHNVGDEYLGKDPALSPWRDTHVRLEGPAVLGVQLSFLKDWYFCTGRTPELSWDAVPAPGEDRAALILASGPADPIETASLLFGHAIASAEQRVWIASPYFVPDRGVFDALQIAALRGVDVRVLIPRQTDSLLFRFVPYAYLAEARRVGVKVFLYEAGFMHQKVVLVDDDYAAVSTANFDNRSFRLNFEITAFLADRGFCADVGAMLEADFARATLVDVEAVEKRSLPFRVAVRVTRLLAPVL